jgi:hypothetical protein
MQACIIPAASAHVAIPTLPRLTNLASFRFQTKQFRSSSPLPFSRQLFGADSPSSTAEKKKEEEEGVRSERFKVRATGTGIGMAGLGKLNKEEELQVYPNVEELSVSLAAHVADVSASAVEARGGFSVVLSGGSLIKTLR